MNKRSDEEFIALIRGELDRDLKRLEPRLIARLDSIRQQALQVSARARDRDEETLVQIARQAPGSQHALPGDVEQRLDRIRRQALARMPGQQSPAPAAGQRPAWLHSLLTSWRLPAGMVATGFVLATALSLILPGNSTSDFSLEQELALVATADDIELYQNLDFYLWLAENGFAEQQ